MLNINSGKEFFEGKKVYDFTTHHQLSKIRIKRRRRKAYQGIVNQVPIKIKEAVLPFKL